VANLEIQDFGGRLPRRGKRLLPGNYSQEAYNTKLLSGELRGLRAMVPVHNFPADTNPAKVWRVQAQDDPADETWFYSDVTDAELVKCPLIDDAYDRWYLFQSGVTPKVLTYSDIKAGTGPWNLGFSAPATAPTLAPTVVEPLDVRDVVYTYTYITTWGEETINAPAATVSVDDAGSVTVSGFYDPPPAIEGRQYEFVRIYRTITVGDVGGVFFVTEVPWGTDTYNDTLPDVEVSLNEQLMSQSYGKVPQAAYGAKVHPSGALVAFDKQTIYFSEPYRPHAWPEVYRIAVPDNIVGLEVFGQNVGVFTEGRPIMLYGAGPGQIGILKYSFSEPCIAYGSIVGSPEGAYYASHQGLVMFTSNGPVNITKDAISKEEWQRDYLDSRTSAARYGTQYVAMERPGVGYIIDSLEPRIAFTDIALPPGVEVSSFSPDMYTAELYAVAGDTVFIWDSTDAQETDYVWKSKQQVLPTPVNMGAVMVHIEERVGDEYIPPGPLPQPPFPPEYAAIDKERQVLLEVFMNDERVLAAPCGDREQVRLPSGSKGDAWEIRVTGQCRLYSVALTETGKGQARVR